MATESALSFRQQLQRGWDQGKFVCVGLDADIDKLPFHIKESSRRYVFPRVYQQTEFLERIVDATGDIACAFKPNIAFFEDSPDGEGSLEGIIRHIRKNFPNMPIIGDVKRADIGNTNKGYARAAYDRYGFDAITTNPYFGGDTFGPFQTHEGKGLIVLCKTSNNGSAELQDMSIDILDAEHDKLITTDEFEDLDTLLEGRNPRVYEMVAFMAARRWNKDGNMGLVVGATHPEAFAPVRRLAPDLPFLIPGIGTQGGDLEKTLQYAPDANKQGIIINSSSEILFASSGEDYAEAAREATVKLDTQIRQGLGI